MQGKGLIAIEAFVSLPLERAPHPVLAAPTHVFEFLESDGATTYARALKQLGPLAAVPIRSGAESYEDAMAARGVARGDVKPVALSALVTGGRASSARARNPRATSERVPCARQVTMLTNRRGSAMPNDRGRAPTLGALPLSPRCRSLQSSFSRAAASP